ncbi:MAG: T9SS type A sorting domain-containing protein [Bacteroidetes bacterium]|nr:T9SS type A sorting domain-containing protein [Bacteroidota bacterium]
MKKIFCLLYIIPFLLFISSCFAQSQTPAWLFPIMFKDYNGERDTIYIGYDRNASLNLDTIFGEKPIKIDTSKFNSVFFFWGGQDSAVKTIVWDSTYLTAGNSISFLKGKMPLTMYWYDTLFYSDSLPFPNLSPKPRGRGNLTCGGSICPSGNDIILTDMPGSLPFVPNFTFSDSIVFPGDSTQSGISVNMSLRILPFNSLDNGTGIAELFEENDFNIFPNPTTDIVIIQPHQQVQYSYSIINVLGEIIANSAIINKEARVDISNLSDGLYLIQLKGSHFTVTRKLLKVNNF